MATKTVTVGSTVGLHARPAALIAQAASAASSAVTLAKEGKPPVDAGSALLIMTLGAACGDKVTVESDDEALLAEIASLVEQDLDT
ncbi:MAG: HPr family phosphocarrier protein [Actinomycetota bacterium]|nr:HPr family phosphocarrier protein [Actinomycetota bacterium]